MRLYITKGQLFDKNNNPVVVNCTNGVASYVAGLVDGTEYDITDYVENLDKLDITYKSGEDGKKVREKGSTSQITIIQEGATIVKDWLLSTSCSQLNFFTARIYDDANDINYPNYIIKPDNIEMCETDGCVIRVPLREESKKKSVLSKIIIHDDHQGWFGKNATKSFPTVEVIITNSAQTSSIVGGFFLFVKSIPVIGQVLAAAVDAVNENIVRGLGFGNFLPTPYIRDILYNGMHKIGYTVESPFDFGKDLEQDALFYPYAGIYHNISAQGCQNAPATNFLWNNRSIISMEEFVIELCKVYNMTYEVNDLEKKLTLKFKKDIDNQSEQLLIFDGDVISFCKDFSFEKRPNNGNYAYAIDGADQKSNTVSIAYNDRVDYDGAVDNQLLEGSVEINTQFSSVGFWGDSFGSDVMGDAIGYMKTIAFGITLLLAIEAFITGLIPFGIVAAGIVAGIVAATVATIYITASNLIDDYGYQSCHRGAVHLYGTGQKINMSILRLQPGREDNQAKVIEIVSSTIQNNTFYNTNNVDWADQFNGGYGTFESVFNYPLYYDANYFGNLYDNYFEKTDSFKFFNSTNEFITFELPLCKNYLTFFGVQSETLLKIGSVIEFTYNSTTYRLLVQEFNINYENYLITIKGKRYI